MARAPQASRGAPDAPPTYWLTRFVLLRLLDALYAAAFLLALNQLSPLIGADGLQLLLLLSGNLSFPNWLTILPALAYFDDICWARLLSGRLVHRAQAAAAQADVSRPLRLVAWVATAVLAALSIRPALNLLSPQQVMNSSFDPFDLVTTYGAFGTVGQQRLNIVFKGTLDDNPVDGSHGRPYPYKGLPVSLTQRPPQVAPYQLHLDFVSRR